MLKALVIKELRESAGIVALAVLAAVFTVSSLVGLSLLPMFRAGETSWHSIRQRLVWILSECHCRRAGAGVGAQAIGVGVWAQHVPLSAASADPESFGFLDQSWR